MSGSPAERTGAPELLVIEDLTVPGACGHLSLSVRAGEVVGLAGSTASGNVQVGEAIAGLHRAEDGRISVNGRRVPYGEQRFWAGLASLSYLPATTAPLGLTRDGLPVGFQIIGAEGEDPTTVEFARLLAGESGGFLPPPGYSE